MSLKLKQITVGILLCLLLAALPAGPVAGLEISGISPSAVPVGVASTVTISGTGFESDVIVTLSGYPNPLVITSWSTTELSVIIPEDVSPGVYSITASSVLSPPSALFSSLTVLAAPTPTATPEPTATPVPFGRPQVVIDSYRVNVGEIKANEEFNLVVRLHNAGQINASNLQAVFSSPDLTPTQTGGVSALPYLESGKRADIDQKMRATGYLYGKTSVQVELSISYYDDKGNAYNEKFTLNVPVKPVNYVAASTATPTPAGLKRAQLVITSYTSDVDILQPGSLFALEMNVQNLGNAGARGVTMIVGGGSAGSSSDGTPQPGGVSGGSGEFTNFAPVGTSNIQSLGDFASGATLIATQKLIVNVSTNPGAYPMKVTFSYLDEKGNTVNDEQVITLLVYNLPSVDVSFYQPVSAFFIDQPGFLPLQVTNMGKKMSILGNMKVSTTAGTLENAQAMIGPLESGGYFTLDAMLYPEQPGPLALTVTIDYLDDFNQPRSITQTLNVEVLEMEEPPIDPNFPEGGEGEIYPPSDQEETFWQKTWRFILGLFGLDSGKANEEQFAPSEHYEETMPGVTP